MGRKQNDVFVLGDESIGEEHVDTRSPEPGQVKNGQPAEPEWARRASTNGGLSGSAVRLNARHVAMLGLCAGIALAVVVLSLSSRGDREAPHVSETSPVSLPVSASSSTPRSATSVQVAPKPKSGPKSKSKNGKSSNSGYRSDNEHKRETTSDAAPVSSSFGQSISTPTPVPVVSPLPPSAPPSYDGGASGGREEFGFER